MTQSKEDTSLYCLLYSVVVLSSEKPQYNYWLSTVVVVDEGIHVCSTGQREAPMVSHENAVSSNQNRLIKFVQTKAPDSVHHWSLGF